MVTRKYVNGYPLAYIVCVMMNGESVGPISPGEGLDKETLCPRTFLSYVLKVVQH
jgi:hypothetical protein